MRPRASRSTTRTASAPTSRRSCSCLLVAGAWRRGQTLATRAAATAVAIALGLQIAIGMNLIWKGWPLWLGTAHNAGAVLVVLTMVALLRYLSPRTQVGRYRP